jgi:hypothetical protein
MAVMTDNNLIQALATYRLEHDLSFDQLANEMVDAGYGMRGRALHLLLTNRLRSHPRERTLYKIQQFLAGVGAKRNRNPRRRRTSRSAA